MKKKNDGCLWLFLIVVAIIIIVGVFQSGSKSEPDMNLLAYVVAQDRIKARLKAPATAEFPTTSNANIVAGPDNVWTVSAYVDSQNSFGANLRNNWTVKLQYLGNDPEMYENWKTLDVDIK